MSREVIDGGRNPVPGGHQRINATAGVQSLTVPARAKAALFYAETEVYFTDDGTAPAAATVGIGLAAGEKFFLAGDLSTVKFNGGIVRVLYYY